MELCKDKIKSSFQIVIIDLQIQFQFKKTCDVGQVAIGFTSKEF